LGSIQAQQLSCSLDPLEQVRGDAVIKLRFILTVLWHGPLKKLLAKQFTNDMLKLLGLLHLLAMLSLLTITKKKAGQSDIFSGIRVVTSRGLTQLYLLRFWITTVVVSGQETAVN
jgi:hypothetical protein